MIPKIIHQVWIGPLAPPLEWINTWRQAHPGWEHRLWSEEDFDFPLPCLRQVLLSPTYAGKVDILSYEIMKKFGGVYLDADSVCLRPLDKKLMEKNFLIAYENEATFPGRIAHGVMGSPVEHPVFDDLINTISRLTPEQMSDFDYEVTGPGLITKVVSKYKNIDVLPSYLFYPFYWNGKKFSAAPLTESYAIQIWGSENQKEGVIPSAIKKLGFKQCTYSGNRDVGQMPAVLNAVPVQNTKYELLKQEEGYFLAGDSNYWGHQLSETSAIAWQLCNDGLTVQEIIDLLASEHPADAKQIQRDIYDVILEFIKMGFAELHWQAS